jgi:16S rRNA (guanine966-N2)-methyltransferase
MRIISGFLKGRVFEPPPKLGIRPTMDRAREALFNMLFSRIDIEDAEVLDVFAGSGAVGFEAISRGAAHVTAIEQQAPVVAYLKATAEKFDIADQYTAVQSDALRFLQTQAKPAFFIFLDPPYALAHKEMLVEVCFTRELLQTGGLIVLEHGTTETFEGHERLTESRSYGGSTFSFFR